MLRDAGAKKVYLASYTPPIKYSNLYGIDIPTKEELIAATMSLKDIQKHVAADELIYGNIEDILESCTSCNGDITDLDMSCFDGIYKTGDVNETILKKQDEMRKAERVYTNFAEDQKIAARLNLLE